MDEDPRQHRVQHHRVLATTHLGSPQQVDRPFGYGLRLVMQALREGVVAIGAEAHPGLLDLASVTGRGVEAQAYIHLFLLEIAPSAVANIRFLPPSL